jgi:hypothetical protein
LKWSQVHDIFVNNNRSRNDIENLKLVNHVDCKLINDKLTKFHTLSLFVFH